MRLAQQRGPARQPTTASRIIKMTWNKETNRAVMECYLRIEPVRRGYRKRMLEIWKGKSMVVVSEQRLADQVSSN